MHTQSTNASRRTVLEFGLWLLAMLLAVTWYTPARAAPANAPVAGEVQFITLDTPGDHWSGGTVVVGGTVVTIPRNLLIDLPANRLTLNQLYEQAPAECLALGETGLAKGDVCNLTGMGAVVGISANRTNGGNVIAGDMFIEKAAESVTGHITYIDYTQGYFRVNGNVGDATTGVMVRLNDPDQRHTVQQGLGCAVGSLNCSADPRFTLDGNNYTNVYTTGYPICIPSTVARTVSDVAPDNLVSRVFGVSTVTGAASAAGTGDVLCPESNRATTMPANFPPGAALTGVAADSRRMAPIQLGDHILAEGSFETVNGVRFLSAHTTMVSVALTTDTLRLDQPDYFFFAEVFMEAPGFQNQRMRNMYIGFTTVSPADVMIWSLHYDPVTNSVHEFPLASTAGCDAAAGQGSCSAQNINPGAWDIFRIRYDVDFGIGAKPLLDPCAHLKAEPRFGTDPLAPICPNSPILDPNGKFNIDVTGMMGVLQPVAHEIQGRTGRKVASMQAGGTPLVTLDIKGAEATNGQYLYPLGMNLGGIEVAEMSEIDLGMFNSPLIFSGIPWNMDRRLGPGGCNGPCETAPQPLDPFPFEGLAMDPRTQAPPTALFLGLPQGLYTDANFSATPLTRASNRVLSFVDPTLTRSSTLGGAMTTGNFNGDLSVLAWPPADPAAQPIAVTPEVLLIGATATPNTPPVAVADAATTDNRTPVTIAVLANDTDAELNVLSVTTVSAVTPAGAGTVVRDVGNTVTFTPAATFVGTASFTYGISDGRGGSALGTVTVTVNQAPNRVPVANANTAVTGPNTPVTINVLANDSDPDGDPLTVFAVTQPANGTVVNNGTSVTFTPAVAATGTATFTYTVSDGRGGLATATVTVNIQAADTLATTQVEFRTGVEWRVSGIGSVNGAVVTIRVGPTLSGPVIGTATVVAGRWAFRGGLATPPDATRTISLQSSAGGTRLAIPVTVR